MCKCGDCGHVRLGEEKKLLLKLYRLLGLVKAWRCYIESIFTRWQNKVITYAVFLFFLQSIAKAAKKLTKSVLDVIKRC